MNWYIERQRDLIKIPAYAPHPLVCSECGMGIASRQYNGRGVCKICLQMLEENKAAVDASHRAAAMTLTIAD